MSMPHLENAMHHCQMWGNIKPKKSPSDETSTDLVCTLPVNNIKNPAVTKSNVVAMSSSGLSIYLTVTKRIQNILREISDMGIGAVGFVIREEWIRYWGRGRHYKHGEEQQCNLKKKG